ncbi:hypothetical protein GCM10020369_68570 [Cryptosporangium minutisporangium]
MNSGLADAGSGFAGYFSIGSRGRELRPMLTFGTASCTLGDPCQEGSTRATAARAGRAGRLGIGCTSVSLLSYQEHRGSRMGSVIKKRRKRMAKKKHRKLLKRTRVQRRNKK